MELWSATVQGYFFHIANNFPQVMPKVAKK